MNESYRPDHAAGVVSRETARSGGRHQGFQRLRWISPVAAPVGTAPAPAPLVFRAGLAWRSLAATELDARPAEPKRVPTAIRLRAATRQSRALVENSQQPIECIEHSSSSHQY